MTNSPDRPARTARSAWRARARSIALRVCVATLCALPGPHSAGSASAQDGAPPAAGAPSAADRELVAKLALPADAGAAEDALAKRGAEALPALVEAVANEKTRAAGLRLIARLGTAARGAAPTLAAQIRSQANPHRAALADTLGAICDASAPATVVDALVAAATSGRDAGRLEAAEAATRILALQAAPTDGRPRMKPEVAGALERALVYLERHQEKAGCWSPATFGARCTPVKACGSWTEGTPATIDSAGTPERCDGSGRPEHAVGITALAAIALARDPFLADHAARRDALNRAAAWLRAQQAADGALTPNRTGRFLYSHCYAGIALAEHFRVTGDTASRDAAREAVKFALSAQTPQRGWRYAVRGRESDTSVTSRVIELVGRASELGCLPPGADVTPALRDGIAYIQEMTDPESYRVGYQTPGGRGVRDARSVDLFPQGKVEPLTACALLARLHAGRITSQRADAATVIAAGVVLRRPPVLDMDEGADDLYYWVNAGEALIRGDVPGFQGTWWPALAPVVLARMPRSNGCSDGAYTSDDPWSSDAGTVGKTALAAICLSLGTADRDVLPAPTPPQQRVVSRLFGAAPVSEPDHFAQWPSVRRKLRLTFNLK